MNGMKFDGDKLRYDLVHPECLREVVKVLTYGAKKYADDNWIKVDNANRRYYAAALRHIEAWRLGESSDTETGISHLAHSICCLLFLLYFDLHPKKEDMPL